MGVKELWMISSFWEASNDGSSSGSTSDRGGGVDAGDERALDDEPQLSPCHKLSSLPNLVNLFPRGFETSDGGVGSCDSLSPDSSMEGISFSLLRKDSIFK